jgi:hypothetical protein
MPTDTPPLDAALDECMLDHKTAFYDLLTQIEIEKGQNSSLFTNDRLLSKFVEPKVNNIDLLVRKVHSIGSMHGATLMWFLMLHQN